jgi:hypothetical protein
MLDGTQIGQVTTDAQGNVRVTLTSLTSSVTIGSNSSLVVQDAQGNTILSGTVAPPSNGSSTEVQDLGVHLQGTGNGEAELRVQGGTLVGLKLEIENAPASQPLNVLLDGTQIGQVTTDAQGSAHLELSSFASPITVGASSSLVIQDSLGNTVLSGSVSSSNDS